MLLAYIDEVGEPGAFVSRSHPKYNTSPAFGYAGFCIPASSARRLGEVFTWEKRKLFASEIALSEHPGRWERKGSELLRPDTTERFPQHIRVLNYLFHMIVNLGGNLFYYAEEKPLGTPRQTDLIPAQRETDVMGQCLNRLCRHADAKDANLLVMIDQINEKTRAERLPTMYGHILGRAGTFPEMKRIVEPPMHIDSALSANIQLADWVAATVTRAIDRQLIRETRYNWANYRDTFKGARGAFTRESKLYLRNRSVADLHHSELLQPARVLYPLANGELMQDRVDPSVFRKMKAAAERAREREARG